MAVGDPVRYQSGLAAAFVASDDQRLVLDLNLVLLCFSSGLVLFVLLHVLAPFASRDVDFDEVVKVIEVPAVTMEASLRDDKGMLLTGYGIRSCRHHARS